MYKIHAALTGFPFALITSLFFVELLKFFKYKNLETVRTICSFLFFLYVIIAFSSGYIADWFLPEFDNETLHTFDEHYFLARILLFVSFLPFLFSYLLKKEYKKSYYYLYLLFLLVNLVFVIVTSMHGGQLVFDHGVGVKASPKP